MEGQLSNPVLRGKAQARHGAHIVSGLFVSGLSAIGIICGLSLAIGLLVQAVPFSEQIAMSLSLLS